MTCNIVIRARGSAPPQTPYSEEHLSLLSSHHHQHATDIVT